MSNERVYVDFHVIQTVPPSCINRDDTGSPKSAVYGGVRRARVSSQSWKRAVRLAFGERFDEADLGVRTKRIVDMVKEKISEKAPDTGEADAQSLSEKIIGASSIKLQDGEAKALFFMSKKQAENLADLAIAGRFDKKEAQKTLNANTGVDVALFGRMVADDPSLNTDASAQVAHAISTHRVDNEFDYFTAKDDLSPEDNAGAGMIGTVEYNSSTMYRYATVAAHELFTQLADDASATAKAISEFTRAFITSMPTGKQNTFANRTLPDGVIVALRTDQPINLVGAFEEPASGKDGGYVSESKCKLAKYANATYENYFGAPEKTWVVGDGFAEFGEAVALPALLDALENELSHRLNEDQ
jgi:CRISPR system Cascade subunit CasC